MCCATKVCCHLGKTAPEEDKLMKETYKEKYFCQTTIYQIAYEVASAEKNLSNFK